MLENQECINNISHNYIMKLSYSILYSIGFSFIPEAVCDYLNYQKWIQNHHHYFCKQVVAISMLYCIKKNFNDFIHIVGLYQMTALLSFFLKKKGIDHNISNQMGALLRFYIRFHEQLKTPAGLFIIFASMIAGKFAYWAEKNLNNLYQGPLRQN